jgi:hypothetical protein
VVDPHNPSNAEQLVNDYVTRGVRTLNTNLRMVSAEECFEAAINDRTHTILLIAEDELVIDAIKRVIGLKRTAFQLAIVSSKSRHPSLTSTAVNVWTTTPPIPPSCVEASNSVVG